MENNKTNKKIGLIIGAVVGGALLLAAVGAPGFASNPVEKAYNRCITVKTQKLSALQGIGYPAGMLSGMVESACGTIRTACQNPESPMCQLMINASFQD